MDWDEFRALCWLSGRPDANQATALWGPPVINGGYFGNGHTTLHWQLKIDALPNPNDYHHKIKFVVASSSIKLHEPREIQDYIDNGIKLSNYHEIAEVRAESPPPNKPGTIQGNISGPYEELQAWHGAGRRNFTSDKLTFYGHEIRGMPGIKSNAAVIESREADRKQIPVVGLIIPAGGTLRADKNGFRVDFLTSKPATLPGKQILASPINTEKWGALVTNAARTADHYKWIMIQSYRIHAEHPTWGKSQPDYQYIVYVQLKPPYTFGNIENKEHQPVRR